jgi:hypothetical protein
LADKENNWQWFVEFDERILQVEPGPADVKNYAPE